MLDPNREDVTVFTPNFGSLIKEVKDEKDFVICSVKYRIRIIWVRPYHR